MLGATILLCQLDQTYSQRLKHNQSSSLSLLRLIVQSISFTQIYASYINAFTFVHRFEKVSV